MPAPQSISDLVSRGLYTPAEAALYARLPLATVNRWMFGNASGDAVLRPEGSTSNRILTFIDLLQLLAVRDIRINALPRVSLQKIREAVRRAEDHYSVRFPLARPHTTFLSGSEILIQLNDREHLVQLSGKAAHNLVKRSIVEHFLKDVSFEGNQPTAFRAFAWQDRTVTIRPEVRLGDPVVSTCGITAQTLADAYQAEGSLEAAAEAYGVTPADVDIAYRYFDHLKGRAAA